LKCSTVTDTQFCCCGNEARTRLHNKWSFFRSSALYSTVYNGRRCYACIL